MSWPRWPMARSTVRKPARASCCRTISRIEHSSPNGTSGFGNEVVYGRRRTPLPPARMTACERAIRERSFALTPPSNCSRRATAIQLDSRSPAGRYQSTLRQATIDILDHPGRAGPDDLLSQVSALVLLGDLLN